MTRSVDQEQNFLLPELLDVPLPGLALKALERALGLHRLQRLCQELRSMGNEHSMVDRLLQRLSVTYRVAEQDLAHIPRRGPAVLVVNHPFGLLEAAVLASVLQSVRPDVKFLANRILTLIPEIQDLLIPVNPMGGQNATRENHAGVRRALEFVGGGGMLLVFPAGEVAHLQGLRQGVIDPEWSSTVARLIGMVSRQGVEVSIVPAYVHGSNSLLFQALGLLHPRLRTAMLARELLNKQRFCVEIRLGRSLSSDKLLSLPTDEDRIRHLRWRTYLLANRQTYDARTRLPLLHGRVRTHLSQPIAPPISSDVLAEELLALPADRQLLRSGDMVVYLAAAQEIPNVLKEIGRLREIAFRVAGEGSQNSRDLDAFDSHYLHLFVWEETTREIIGAYRLVQTDAVRSRYGMGGLYTSSLFCFHDEFLDRLGPALELGRSFIRPEYQKTFTPLLLLWKGIGRYVAEHPQYKVLFGPVSISNQYQAVSRELIVTFLERHASLCDWARLVSGRNPFRCQYIAKLSGEPQDLDELSTVVADLEPAQAGVPILLRQYLKLGGKLLGFHVDPNFSNVLDGLILVDLTNTKPSLLSRYLGKDEAERFLAYHR